MAYFIYNVMTRNKPLFDYDENDLKKLERKGRTDICKFLKEILSNGLDAFIINDGMRNVVVDLSQ